MQKVTICSPQYGLSPHSHAGGEVHDEAVLKGLAQRGYHIEILLPYKKPYDTKQKNWRVEHVSLPYIHTSYLFNVVSFLHLVRTYKRQPFHIVRIHSPYLVGIGAYLFKRLIAPEVKLFATYHHIEPNWIYTLIDKVLANKWDHIFIDSEYSKHDLMQRYSVEDANITVTYNGVPEHYFSTQKNSPTSNKGLSLVFCGLLIQRKRVDFLLHLMTKLDHDTHLTIIGDGPLKRKLEALARTLDISEKVTFKGSVSEEQKLDILRASDVFVFPSRMEGFGLAPAEAMALGLPVIASNQGSLPEVIGNGGIVLPHDEEMWISTITRLKTEKDTLRHYGQEARKQAQQFRWEHVIDTINTYIQRTLQRD